MLGRYILLLGIFFHTLAYCFTSDDTEIFQLQHDLVTKYGEDMNFYKFLKLEASDQSTTKDIKRKFRSLSKKYHPDKNRKYKTLYARLNMITQILLNNDKRKTYDYYLKRGFPKYQYEKGGFSFNRQNLGSWVILFFIYITCSLIHWAILIVQNNGNKRRIRHFLKQVKDADDTAGLGEKRLKLTQHDGEEGKEIIVRFGEVFVVQPDNTEAHITTAGIEDTKFTDSMFFSLPLWICKHLWGRLKRFKQQNAAPGNKDEGVVKTSKKQTTSAAKCRADKKQLPSGLTIHSRIKKD